MVDTTVTESPVAYPTDVNLLETCRKKCVEIIKKSEKTGKVTKKYRTRCRKARRDYVRHQKLGRKSKKERKKMQKKMCRYVKRNLNQVCECIKEMKSQEQNLNKDEKKILSKLELVKERTSKILEQQEKLCKNEKVKERIVSFNNFSVRPMVRGKYPVSVEFGRKNLLIEKDGFLYLAGSFSENLSDQTLMETAISFCEETFGETPLGVGADRGFYSPGNRKACESRGIKRIGIQKKGKLSEKDKEREKSSWFVGLRRRRCGIEGYISVSKRRYGLDRAEYRIADGEEMWCRLGLIGMNLKKSFRLERKSAKKSAMAGKKGENGMKK